EARVRVVHATASADPVDVYLTAPGADLATSPVLDNLSFTEATGLQNFAAGTYQIRATATDDESDVLFDSGDIEILASDDLLIAAVPNTGAGDAPFTLLVIDSTHTVEEYLDVNTPAALRGVHAVPDGLA